MERDQEGSGGVESSRDGPGRAGRDRDGLQIFGGLQKQFT